MLQNASYIFCLKKKENKTKTKKKSLTRKKSNPRPSTCKGNALSIALRNHCLDQLTSTENTITYHNALFCHPKILRMHCFQFLMGPF